MRALFSGGLIAAMTTAALSQNAILIAVVFGILAIAAAYAIAEAGRPTPREPSAHARDVLACPLWLETLALFIEYMLISAGIVLGTWATVPEDFPPMTIRVETVLILLALVFLAVLGSLAIAVWERRDARKLLQSDTQ